MDGQTDGHWTTAKTALAHSVARLKSAIADKTRDSFVHLCIRVTTPNFVVLCLTEEGKPQNLHPLGPRRLGMEGIWLTT